MASIVESLQLIPLSSLELATSLDFSLFSMTSERSIPVYQPPTDSYQRSTVSSRARSASPVKHIKQPDQIIDSDKSHESFSDTETEKILSQFISKERLPPIEQSEQSSPQYQLSTNLPLQLKSSPPQISSPEPTHTARMGYSTIKPFHSLQDGKEDPEEYLKDVEFSYNNDYAGSKASNESNYKETTS